MSRIAHRGKTMPRADFARLWNDHAITLAEIGALLDISPQAVRFRAMARDLPPRSRYPRQPFHAIKPEQEAEFASMWAHGVGRYAMADYFRTNTPRIGLTAQRLGLPKRTLTRWNKITLEQWRAIEAQKRMAEVAEKEQRAAKRIWHHAA
ncbi:hypothetical protein [Antarcticimicrobium luteum]|uniref:Uncharacterized protein n=1 Tax=Antarcticimicrobium luteum TaxID=2547397 RepID=A0A4R5VEJ7_9RHOB|nr:hypothetical protein [Antarcticimicrobium luteum]TDK50832.1 hypothetical protein E1832_05470 [Antarcticimicrobium luteum]